MKLTKETLKQIIKEEMEAMMAESEIDETQQDRRYPPMISMDEYSQMSPEEQSQIDPADVVGYVGPDGKDAYGYEHPPLSGTFSRK